MMKKLKLSIAKWLLKDTCYTIDYKEEKVDTLSINDLYMLVESLVMSGISKESIKQLDDRITDEMVDKYFEKCTDDICALKKKQQEIEILHDMIHSNGNIAEKVINQTNYGYDVSSDIEYFMGNCRGKILSELKNQSFYDSLKYDFGDVEFETRPTYHLTSNSPSSIQKFANDVFRLIRKLTPKPVMIKMNSVLYDDTGVQFDISYGVKNSEDMIVTTACNNQRIFIEKELLPNYCH